MIKVNQHALIYLILQQKINNNNTIMCSRAVRYDYIYRMNKIKSLSFHIMFYRLYRGIAKYIVSGNTFSSFE